MEKKKSIFSSVPSSAAPLKSAGNFNGAPPPPPPAATRAENTGEIITLQNETKKLREETRELKAELKKLREEQLAAVKKTQAEDYEEKFAGLSAKFDSLADDFLSFTRDEAGAGKRIGEFDAARKKAIRELEKIKEDYSFHLKKFDSRLLALDKKVQSSAGQLEDELARHEGGWDEKLAVFKDEAAAAVAVEDRRVLALVKSLEDRVKELEQDCRIVIKNKLLLLETKTQLVDTLSKRLETISAGRSQGQ